MRSSASPRLRVTASRGLLKLLAPGYWLLSFPPCPIRPPVVSIDGTKPKLSRAKTQRSQRKAGRFKVFPLSFDLLSVLGVLSESRGQRDERARERLNF